MVETKTRSGRQIKKPNFYAPEETVLEDDYASDEHDSNLGSDIDTEDEYESEDGSEYDTEDEGSIKDFVVDDEDCESEEEDT
jgi:hypothetical protein